MSRALAFGKKNYIYFFNITNTFDFLLFSGIEIFYRKFRESVTISNRLAEDVYRQGFQEHIKNIFHLFLFMVGVYETVILKLEMLNKRLMTRIEITQ